MVGLRIAMHFAPPHCTMLLLLLLLQPFRNNVNGPGRGRPWLSCHTIPLRWHGRHPQQSQSLSRGVGTYTQENHHSAAMKSAAFPSIIFVIRSPSHVSLFPEQVIFILILPRRSVCSQPQRFGTDSLHFLCTFISQAADVRKREG